MKYEEMSDFELNRKLFQLVTGCSESLMERNTAALVQYCTDWSATMPLAVEYGVSPLIADDNFNHATTDPYEAYEPHGLGEADGFFSEPIKDKSQTLRAIVICLIKVLESKLEDKQ